MNCRKNKIPELKWAAYFQDCVHKAKIELTVGLEDSMTPYSIACSCGWNWVKQKSIEVPNEVFGWSASFFANPTLKPVVLKYMETYYKEHISSLYNKKIIYL